MIPPKIKESVALRLQPTADMDLLTLQLSPLALAGLVLGGTALLFIAMFLRRRTDAPSDRTSTPARVFLVLLRITIGWHFLVEGLDKLSTPNWSSEGYLREASGPLAPRFREMAGDSVLAQLTLGDDKAIPPALADDWQRYFDAFVVFHKFDDAQTKTAQAKFDQAQTAVVAWMLKPRAVKKQSPIPPDVFVELSIPDRLKQYEELQKELAKVEADMPERGKKSWSDWQEAKGNVAKWRGDLKKDLDAQTVAFKKSLADTLSAEQKTSRPREEPVAQPRPFDRNRQLDVADAAVKYGLIAIGVGLIAGCFTRLAAVGGAVLLLMFFLAMPPLPYLPESPKAEGHYLYINKNIIEMFALLALACLPTGRWAGVDGLLQFLNPFNWRRTRTQTSVVQERMQPKPPGRK